MKTTQATIQSRQRHHAALEQLARHINPVLDKSGLQLWRQLRRVELQATQATTAACNGEISQDDLDAACTKAEFAVRKSFGGCLPPKFQINRDPRGYALKLASSDDGSEVATPFALHQDWGRNQILAPEIN